MDKQSSSDNPIERSRFMQAVDRHSFAAMIVCSIVIALVLVSVALWLYDSSGAAEVDLSRPEYQSVRDKSKINDTNTLDDNYSANGPINKDTLKEFSDKFDAHIKQLNTAGDFNPKALDDDVVFASKIKR